MENGVLVTYSTSESAAKVDGGNMEGGQVTTKSMDGTALKQQKISCTLPENYFDNGTSTI